MQRVVDRNVSSLTVVTLFDVNTKEEQTVTVDDSEYMYGESPYLSVGYSKSELKDLDETPIDREARKAWLHYKGIIQKGDKVKVVKGRKVPIGTVAVVDKIAPFYNRYGRKVSVGARLSNGEWTSLSNLELTE